jgi:hypothetical protein
VPGTAAARAVSGMAVATGKQSRGQRRQARWRMVTRRGGVGGVRCHREAE